MYFGTIRYLSPKGYAFLVLDGHDVQSRENNVFAHVSAFNKSIPFDSNLVGKRVKFELMPASVLGKPPQATNVHILTEDSDNVRAGGVSVLGGGAR
jgi:hypothetical protein